MESRSVGTTYVQLRSSFASFSAWQDTFRGLVSSATAALLILLQTTPTLATTFTWSGGTSTNFETGSNWVGGNAPSSNPNKDIALFTGSVTTFQPSLTGDRGLNGLSFASSGWTLGGSSFTLTLDTTGITTTNASGTNTITTNILLNGSQTWSIASGGTLAMNGIISGNSTSFTLTKSGGGTLTLGGNSTHIGPTSITAGTLIVTANNALGGTNSGTTVSSGATLGFQGSINYSTTEAVTINGTGVSSAGAISNQSGTNAFAGAVTLASASTIGSSAGILTLSGAITNAGFLLTLNGAGDLTLSGAMGGTGGATYTGSGTLTLSGTNTFSGVLTVQSGTLSIGTINNASANGVLGNSANAVVMGGSGTTGTMSYTGATASSTKTFTMAAGGTGVFGVTNSGTTLTLSGVIGGTGNLTKSGPGTLAFSGANTFSGVLSVNNGNLSIGTINNASVNGVLGNSTNAVVLGSNGYTGTLQYTGATASSTKKFTMASGGTGAFQIDTAGTTLTLSGIIDGTGALSKTGAGTLALSGINTYSGGTTISAGTLQLSGSGTLGSTSGSLTVNGGTLDLNSTSQGVGNLTGSGGTILNNATGTNVTATIGNGNATGGNYAGVIANHTSGTGTVALTKTGTGTLTLSGANTFTGATTVNNGTLILATSSGSALGSTTSVTVNSGGTLLLGAINQINNSATMILNGGTFAKGDQYEGTASAAGIGALTLTLGGSHIDFGTGTVGVLTFASFTPGSYTLAIDNWTGVLGQVGSGSTDRLIFNSDQTANLSTFQFAGYAPGAIQFNLGSGFYEVVPVTAVPEPSTWFAGLLTVGVVGWSLRRRLPNWQRVRESNPCTSLERAVS